MSRPGPVMIVLGIRPDVIRASEIIKGLMQELRDNLVFVWSGQHYSENLKDIFFRQLEVPAPTHSLNLSGYEDSQFVSQLVAEMDELLVMHQPQAVVFLGDTNTVLGCIAPAIRNVPILHIEGCMRSYDWRMPEEKNRVTIDHLSDVIYAYLEDYRQKGIREGLRPESVLVTGNPIVDILRRNLDSGRLRLSKVDSDTFLSSLGLKPASPFGVMTCHRRENVDDYLSLERILTLAGTYTGQVVFPAGYRTQRNIDIAGLKVPENLLVIDPVGYAEMLELCVRSQSVLTDSGTLVEEACILGVPSIQMRTATERPEVYTCGASIKFDPHIETSEADMREVINQSLLLLEQGWEQPFGDGRASERIVDDILRRFEDSDFAQATLKLAAAEDR